MPTKAEMQAELKRLAATIKNHSKRRRVLKEVKANLERKYGIKL